MYYITSFNRFGQKYTQECQEKPFLQQRFAFCLPNTGLTARILTEEEKQYHQFRIPKASGGFRTITAPSNALKIKQRLLVDYLQEHCQIQESSWAYAYVKRTCAVDALKLHQANKSRWFLKLDIRDFFPSCKKEIVEQSLQQIYPICSWPEEHQQSFFEQLDNYCYYNNELPQGAVSSPLLANLTLTPYDYQIHKMLQRADNFKKQKYVFTRYADDILISAKEHFEWQNIAHNIQVLFGPNFHLKKEKTRYGSSAGRNWNLGCMLNKDNNLTIGYRQKEEWKRKMMDIIIRFNNNEPIPLQEKQELQGKLAYYKTIEPGYFNYINKHYIDKYHTDFEAILKQQI